MFLIRNKTGEIKKTSKAHVWLGSDTACKMASTGGLLLQNFKLYDSRMGLDVCAMCKNNSRGDNYV